jgi:hypothetical protein
VPVGFVEPGTAGATVAVKVTAWLTIEIADDGTTVVVVAVAPTDSGAVPVLVMKFVSPVYAALIV